MELLLTFILTMCGHLTGKQAASCKLEALVCWDEREKFKINGNPSPNDGWRLCLKERFEKDSKLIK